MIIRSLSLCLLVSISLIAQATPVVYTYDFIPDSSRSRFNGFENAPVSGWYYNGTFPYVEDGISVSQVADSPKQIWMRCGAIKANGYCFGTAGHDGNYSWYPNGGDDGYTKITRADGLNFANVGFVTGNGYTISGAAYLHYVLLENGLTVLEGQILIPKNSPARGYLGFGGGGFDEILVSEPIAIVGTNVLAVDSIEMSNFVPEPQTLALLLAGLGLIGIMATTRKREATQ